MTTYNIPANTLATLLERLIPICSKPGQGGPDFINLREFHHRLMGEATDRMVALFRYADEKQDCPDGFALQIMPGDAKRILQLIGSSTERKRAKWNIVLTGGDEPAVTLELPTGAFTYPLQKPTGTFPTNMHRLVSERTVTELKDKLAISPTLLNKVAGKTKQAVVFYGTDHPTVTVFSCDRLELGMVIALKPETYSFPELWRTLPAALPTAIEQAA